MRVLLFTGKGGVGKTTLAAATAAELAARGRKALVISTDPAHSLGDSLDVPVAAEPSEVDGGLFASEVDTRALVDGAWDELRNHLGTVLAGAGVDEVVAEELTVLPGVEELLALAEVARQASTGQWEAVVVDCAPTAESLRLLALPEAAAGYLERLFPTHRRVVRGLLAGMAGATRAAERWDSAVEALGRLAERLEALRGLLVDQATTSVRLVFTPERVVVAETCRTIRALALQGIRVDGLIANRLVPAPAPAARGLSASWLRTRRAEQDAVLAGLRTDVGGLPVRSVGHRAAEPVGLSALAGLAAELYAGADPLDGAGAAPLLEVQHAGGRGTDAEYSLRLAVPLLADATVQLARVGDELVVTAGTHRRLVDLPSVLRRCDVTGAELDGDGLLVRFRPNPDLWMR